MPVTTPGLKAPTTKSPVQEARKILGPGGNRTPIRAPPAQPINKQPCPALPKMPSDTAVRRNVSVDSSCFSDSSSSSSSSSITTSLGLKTPPRRERLNAVKVKSVKVSPVGSEISGPHAGKAPTGVVTRCEWITANSDPLYISFHDEEWGVPVFDDDKLFELLCLSIALAEHTWVSILCKRDVFRKLFDEFNPASVASFSEEKVQSIIAQSSLVLSEPRIRAIVDNAKQTLQVQKQFGSLSNYLWRFVNNKPIENGFRYQRLVPVKTPKAEFISKDLMQRGFRGMGPTVVYSFMQVSGMVNDHLTTCSCYEECCSSRQSNKG